MVDGQVKSNFLTALVFELNIVAREAFVKAKGQTRLRCLLMDLKLLGFRRNWLLIVIALER